METTLNKQVKKFALLLGIVVAIFLGSILPVSADTNPIPKEVNKWESNTIQTEDYALLKKYIQKLEEVETSNQRVIIYDVNDNLILESTIDVECINEQIETLIEKSDLIMNYDGGSYFKISK